MKRLLFIATLVLALLVGSTAFAEGVWTNATDMSTGRAGHTATVLQDGRVLVVGGINNENEILSSVEIYNPASNTWTLAANMNIARIRHTATLLSDGKVLVVGGEASTDNNDASKSAEVYDPVKNTWSMAGNMQVGRTWHTATLLSNSKVLVTGGISSTDSEAAEKSTEIYDPINNTWSKSSDMSIYRIGHTATLLSDGKVLIVGGISSSDSKSSEKTAEVYDPNNDSWRMVKDMHTCRAAHNAVLLPAGKVMVIGGVSANTGEALSSAEIYDPITDTWNMAGNMKMGRIFYSSILLPSGKVLVMGGYSSGADSVSNSTELYDPHTNTWNSCGYMRLVRTGHTAILLLNGKVLVSGGVDSNNEGHDKITEIFDPTASEFSTAVTPMVNNSTILCIGNNKAYANGNAALIDSTNLDVVPFIKDDRTLVPARFIAESLGATVGWDDKTSTATITLGSNKVKMTLGSNIITVNGDTKEIDVPAQTYNDRTFIPLRALVESLGKNVFWDDRGLIVISGNDNVFDAVKDKAAIDEIISKFENIKPTDSYELMVNESIGFLKLGISDSEVTNSLGQPDEKGDAVIWGADGEEHQSWDYTKKGIYLDMVRNDNGSQNINMITIKNPCTYKTSRKIGIGSTKSEAVNAYKNEINYEESADDYLVIGSIYGGVIINFENDRVTSIFIGASAE